jgi:cell wall-associated NlpC family hydrolase
MIFRRTAAALGLVALAALSARGDDKFMIVGLPSTDVRSQPAEPLMAETLKSPYPMDPRQETQLVFGEVVRVSTSDGEWSRVEAVEQKEFTHSQKWEGYPGWVKTSHLFPRPTDYAPNAVVKTLSATLIFDGLAGAEMELPLGSRLVAAREGNRFYRVSLPRGVKARTKSKHVRLLKDAPKNPEALRRGVIDTAQLFVGQPYFWGGRTPHQKNKISPTGVDCSALVNLACRVNGRSVPRDAQEQYMASRPVAKEELLPADLIFLSSPDDFNRITHVMIYLGGDKILEAVHEFDIVRVTTVRACGRARGLLGTASRRSRISALTLPSPASGRGSIESDPSIFACGDVGRHCGRVVVSQLPTPHAIPF